VVLQPLGRPGKILADLRRSEDVGVIALIDRIVDELLDQVPCLLFLDQPRRLRNEVLGIGAILVEDRRLDCRFPLRFDPGFSSRSDPGCW